MTETRLVKLPEDLCAAAEKAFAGKFNSVEELLTLLLRDLMAGDALQADEAEQRLVEERLRELGYL
jgi:hypothetical protein